MTSVAEAPSCPRCGESMVLKTAARGSYAGQQFWACPRFPQCWGKRGISGQPAADDPTTVAHLGESDRAGASAQAVFESRLAQRRRRIRRLWPVAVGITIVGMVMAFLSGLAIGQAWLGAVGAALMAAAMLYVVVDRPQFIDAWRIGSEGERKTSDRLRALQQAGFVVLHDRKAPGYGGNIDHLAIGPSGVWVIETKSLKGSVDVTGDRLFVNGNPQDKILQQVYREATAVQIALRDVLAPLATTVSPVLCLHRARLPFFDRQSQGVTLVSAKTLTPTIRKAAQSLTPDQVQRIADEADRILPRARTG